MNIINNRITIYTSIMSLYVRKVLMALEFKRIPYEVLGIKPNVPKDRKELLNEIHPLEKISVLIDNIV